MGSLLEQWARHDPDGELARHHRIGPTLALRMAALKASTLEASDFTNETLERIGDSAVAAWKRQMRVSSVQQMHLEAAMEEMADAWTESAGQAEPIAWTPIKGMDLCSRPGVYDRPEERPTADLDILIHPKDLDRAQAFLRRRNWQDLNTGRRVESYLRQEGYAWQARSPEGALLELHHRLWGFIHPEAAVHWLESADSDPSLPSGGRRLRPAHAFMVAAIHLWLDPAPRSLCGFRDLLCLPHSVSEEESGSDLEAFAQEVIEDSKRFDLQLPLWAAAEYSRRLWPDQAQVSRVFEQISRSLADELRGAEKVWLENRQDLAELPLWRMVLARHTAGRRSRHPLSKTMWRKLWAHPGVVAAGSEDHWPWWARRLAYQSASWGWKGGRRLLLRVYGPADSGRATPN